MCGGASITIGDHGTIERLNKSWKSLVEHFGWIEGKYKYEQYWNDRDYSDDVNIW